MVTHEIISPEKSAYLDMEAVFQEYLAKKSNILQRVLKRAEDNEQARQPQYMSKYANGGRLAAIPFVAAYLEAAEDERYYLESMWKPPRELVDISRRLNHLVEAKGMSHKQFVEKILLVKHEQY